MRYEDILYFWFTDAGPKKWWKKSDAFDGVIKRKYQQVYEAAYRGECASWRDSARGRLAEIIVLDQFPRNMFRNSPRSFEADGLALMLSQEAVRLGADQLLNADEKAFLYMPHMHSESLKIHRDALRLFNQPGLEDNLSSEHRHREIIERFGRYPHRNKILGRKSTPEEIEFLKQPGSGF
ncbi:DUF924 family protein [Kordiimonas sp. SCSIO 12610]|uniref:DUF924 family protein n=1 Tax=Kordiimonas sp. SCSIO 12610 TaxID=2829597 RepID=UPI00210AC343|nr:DUF924 family protein [Kordiimonas sp. SCSIO 12610]UTW53812.1 DUF924 domain-containing protein [Kordiimonas sp. SCSIO 12610]